MPTEVIDNAPRGPVGRYPLQGNGRAHSPGMMHCAVTISTALVKNTDDFRPSGSAESCEVRARTARENQDEYHLSEAGFRLVRNTRDS
ncbi:hypothetical protein [Streptomyces sp. SYSU K21746]